jgi:uncharacterized protein (DUF362 family)
VAAALEQLADQVRLDKVRRVLIKPNFVLAARPLATTHVAAVRAVLDFVRARYSGDIIVAEGAALSPTADSFREYGYEPLVGEYGVELVDLNADETEPVRIYDRRLHPVAAYLARAAVESDYRISVCPPKTHDSVIVTLSVKNMVMGALVNPRVARQSGGLLRLARRAANLMPERVKSLGLAEWAKGTLFGAPGGSSKSAMHQGVPILNLNLALAAPLVWPHLAVIDGWEGMEGDGPGSGRPVDWRVALAGLDPLAVDVLATHLMGFDPGAVGYLHYCHLLGLGVGDLQRIEVAGRVAPDVVRRSFTPHFAYQRQLAWHLEGAEEYLRHEASPGAVLGGDGSRQPQVGGLGRSARHS